MPLDRNLLPIEDIGGPQPRGPSKQFGYWIDHRSQEIEKRLAAGKMADQHNAAARFAYPYHLVHHPARLRNDRHNVECRDPVKAVVGEFQLLRIALAQFDVACAISLNLGDRMREHIVGRIDTDDPHVGWISTQRNASADPNFKDLLSGTESERFNYLLFVIYKCAPEN